MFHDRCAEPIVRNFERPPIESALPAGFFQRLRGLSAGQGERRLAVAVLEDAVRCLERHHGGKDFPGRLLYWEAEQWIDSRDREPVFSFENVCAILGLPADEMRRQLHRWRKRRHQGSTPPSPERGARPIRQTTLVLAPARPLRAQPGAQPGIVPRPGQ